jgi:hypothetical protein
MPHGFARIVDLPQRLEPRVDLIFTRRTDEISVQRAKDTVK